MSRRTSLEQLILLVLLLASVSCVVGTAYVVIGEIVTTIKYH